MCRPTDVVNEPFALDMDCEKLIAAVKERHILYVYSTKSYKNAELKAKAWEEVANELDVDWYAISILNDIMNRFAMLTRVNARCRA